MLQSIVVFFVFLLLFVLIPLAEAAFVYSDIKNRNIKAKKWIFISAFTPGFLGLIIYLFIREDYKGEGELKEEAENAEAFIGSVFGILMAAGLIFFIGSAILWELNTSYSSIISVMPVEYYLENNAHSKEVEEWLLNCESEGAYALKYKKANKVKYLVYIPDTPIKELPERGGDEGFFSSTMRLKAEKDEARTEEDFILLSLGEKSPFWLVVYLGNKRLRCEITEVGFDLGYSSMNIKE